MAGNQSGSQQLTEKVTIPAPGKRRGSFGDAIRDSGLRRFSSGTLAWGTGHQMVTASQGFVLLELTDSTLWIAWLGGAVAAANILTAIIGGILADRIQRRTLLMLGAATVGLPMLAIGILYATDLLEPWHILIAGAAQGTSLALDWISRLSLLPTVVSRRIVVSALSIDQAVFNASRVIGPLVAAVILASVGPGASYGVIAGLFAAAIMVYATFKVQPPSENGEREKMGFGSVYREFAEGADALRKDTILSLNVLFTAMNAMMLGGFVYMIAAFADQVFESGEFGLGLIFATTGAGAFLGAMIVATRGGMKAAGRGLLVSNLLFASAAALYALTGNTWQAAFVAFFFGLFNAIHVSLGISTIQVNVADHLRGRVTGIYELAWASFPLGGFVVGTLAEVVSLRGAIAITAGAVATLTITVFALSPTMRSLSLITRDD